MIYSPMETFQSNGNWWVPGASEKISGKVSFSPTQGVVLELNGNLPAKRDESEDLLRTGLEKNYNLLYGDLGRDGSVTVQDATITSAHFGGQNESEEYLAERMVVGEHLPENPSFVRADFVVDEIPSWTNSSTVRPVVDSESVEEIVDFGEIMEVYAATSPIDYTADLDRIQIELSNYSKTSFGITSAEIETVGVLKVISDDEVSLSSLLGYGNLALEYLSFAVGTGVYPDKIKLRTERDAQPLDAYYTLIDHTTDTTSSKADYLFHPQYADFETTLRNWIELCESAPEVHENYRLLMHRSNISPRLRFLATVIALEAFHDSEHQSEKLVSEEEFDTIQSDIMDVVPEDTDLQNQIYGLLENVANTPSIKDKLLNLMESEQEIIEMFFDISELASEARNRRNEVAHGSTDATSRELWSLSMKLILVLEVLLARRIGVPEKKLPDALISRHRGLVEQLNISEVREE